MTERQLTLSLLVAIVVVFASVANRVGVAHALGSAAVMSACGFITSVLFQRIYYNGLSRLVVFCVICFLAYHLSFFEGLNALKLAASN